MIKIFWIYNVSTLDIKFSVYSIIYSSYFYKPIIISEKSKIQILINFFVFSLFSNSVKLKK